MTIAAECLEMDGAALLEALDHMIALMLKAGCNIALIALIVRAILAPSGPINSMTDASATWV